MAAYSYPPWASAPSTLDCPEKKGKWWKNTKEALKKPWRWKQGKERRDSPPFFVQSTPPQGLRDRASPFGAFPVFMPQPGGFREGRRFSEPENGRNSKVHERATEEATDFELPQYKAPPRPLLSNVFTMYNTPSLSANKPPANRRQPEAALSTPRGAPVHREIPSLRTGKGDGEEEGESEEEDEEEGEWVTTEVGRLGEKARRHPPSGDSVVSKDRSLERQQRRAQAVRELPQLPKRSHSFDRADVSSHYSLPEAAIRRHRRPTPYVSSAIGHNIIMDEYGRPIRPTTPAHKLRLPSPPRPNGPLPNGPMAPPPQGLPPVSEEADSEIKGFDSFMMY